MSVPRSRVPRLAEAMLKALLDSRRREFVMGDLEEEYLSRREERGAVNTYFWYWRHAVGSIVAQAKSAGASRPHAAVPRPAQRRTAGMFVSGLAGDVKFALRSLRQNPTFSIVAIGTLTLGIGANTAIFTVVDSVILRQLPYEDAERVVAVWPENFFSQEQFDRFREQITSYDYLTAYSQNGFTRSDKDVAELVMGPHVSAEFFSVLGARMEFGRGFVEGEDRPGADPVVVISHGLWQREFGDGANPLGRTIGLDGTVRTIVGVLPQGFDAIQRDAEVLVPLRLDPAEDMYTVGRYLRVIGRLRPGVTAEQAQEEVRTIAGAWRAEYGFSDSFGRNATVNSLRDQLVAGVRPTLFMLLGAVTLTLLIACANVANLFMARGLKRHREIAVRAALGAGRSRLLSQVLTESVVLGLIGGALGFALAVVGVRALVSFMPADIPRLAHISADGRVLAFAAIIALATGILFGLIPAIRASRPNLQSALREGGRGAVGTRGGRVWRPLLVAGQVAIAVILVIGAGLLIESFWRIQRVDPGIEPANLLTFMTIPPFTEYDGARVVRFHSELIERITGLPGVTHAGTIQTLPVSGAGWVMSATIEGQELPQGQRRPRTYWRVVSSGYREAVGMRLLSGRDLVSSDVVGQPNVALVNETLARQFWPGEDPVGKRFIIAFDNSDWITVAGVVADVRHLGLNVPVPPTTYRPYPQAAPALVRVGTIGVSFVVRTLPGQAIPSGALRREVHALDPGVPVIQMTTMNDAIQGSLDSPRFTMLLLGLFAGTALLLGAIGVYGVISFAVSEQTHEIGVRIALGADGNQVVRTVVLKGLLVAGAGVVAGVVGALGATRALSGLVFGVGTTDLSTFFLVPLVVMAVAGMACLIPARRASKVDPMVALRLE